MATTRMRTHGTLFRKYLIIFASLVSGTLLASGAISLYFSYHENRNALVALQREKAEAAASRIEQNLFEIVRHIGLTAPLKPGEDALAKRMQEVRLLRQLPAISDIILVDNHGLERLRVARIGMDVVDSRIDHSRSMAFQQARTGKPYFSPVYFRRDAEPYITIAMAVGPEEAGVTVVQLNLQFLLDAIKRISVGKGGNAYAVDEHGKLIAHLDLALVLRKTDLSALPQVRTALSTRPGEVQAVDGADLDGRPVFGAYASVEPLGWRVFVEQRSTEAFATLHASVKRIGLLLLGGLVLALVMSTVLVRRMVTPIRALQEGAVRIGEGALDQSIDVRTGDELEALAHQFNSMVRRLSESYADLEHKVEERTAHALEARRLAEDAHKQLIDMTATLPLTVFQYRMTADGESGFVFVGENAIKVLGVSAAEIMADQNACWRTTPPEECAMIEPQVRRALKNRLPAEFHHRVEFGGQTKWVHAYMARSQFVDGAWIWSGVWTDETAEREQAKELREAKEQAEEATHTKSMFLANMSHEIRTPMNAIIGLSHLALKTGLTPQQLDYVTKIHNAGTSLLGIINDILDFSKIEAGKLEIENTPFSLDKTMENLATVIGDKVAQKGLELVFDIAPDVPQVLVGDPLRLEQILTNLVGNAVKFTERGEVKVRVERILCTSNEVTLKFSVSDTGIGMTLQQVARLFRAFTQADGSTTRKYGGTGLGLTISKRLVELMGGAIWVESEPDAGSTFSFTLKLGLSGSTIARILPPELARQRVLIVDDHAAARRVLALHCQSLGLIVDVVVSGQEAVDAVRSAQWSGQPYSLVFMDWSMPGMSGAEAARTIRSEAGKAGEVAPKIVMVTAFGREDVRGEAQVLALDGFLVKPVGASALFDTLMRLCGKNVARREHAAISQNGASAAGLRVLLVEDNVVNQQIAVELLKGGGVEVDVAENGRIALDKLRAHARYDLVLMDLQMPEMDGYATATEIRADARFNSLPVIAMTAHAMSEERERCFAAGMNDHIAKPIDPQALFDTLRRWDGRRLPLAIASAVLESIPAATEADTAGDEWIDIQSALRRVAGNTALYYKLLRQFADGHASSPAQIDALLAADDRSAAERIAHNIKGVAGNIGAQALAEAASRLEKTIRTGEDNMEPARDFAAAMTATLKAIDRLLPQDASAHTAADSTPRVTRKLSKDTFQLLIGYLSTGDGAAVDCFAEHGSELMAVLGPKARELEAAINDFDFTTALAVLDTAAEHMNWE